MACGLHGAEASSARREMVAAETVFAAVGSCDNAKPILPERSCPTLRDQVLLEGGRVRVPVRPYPGASVVAGCSRMPLGATFRMSFSSRSFVSRTRGPPALSLELKVMLPMNHPCENYEERNRKHHDEPGSFEMSIGCPVGVTGRG